jgi:hypothetical protein
MRYTDPSGHEPKPCWATKHYSCNLTQNDINKLLHGSKDEQAFIKNLLPDISIINIDMSPSAVTDLITELESWNGGINWMNDVGIALEGLGISIELLALLKVITLPETAILDGAVLLGMGATVTWTQNDLDAIHDDLIKLSDNGKKGVNFSFNVHPGGWNVKLDDVTTVSHLSVHPMLTPKGMFNLTPLWIFGWYACDYNMKYGQGCSWGR